MVWKKFENVDLNLQPENNYKLSYYQNTAYVAKVWCCKLLNVTFSQVTISSSDPFYDEKSINFNGLT